MTLPPCYEPRQSPRTTRLRWSASSVRGGSCSKATWSTQRRAKACAMGCCGAAALAYCLDASVALVNGNYDATQPFSAHVRMNKVAAGDLQALVGSSYPVSGQVSGDVQVQGTEHHLSGSGRISLEDGTAWRQAVRRANAEVNFTGERSGAAQHRGEQRRDATERQCAHQRGDRRVWL